MKLLEHCLEIAAGLVIIMVLIEEFLRWSRNKRASRSRFNRMAVILFLLMAARAGAQTPKVVVTTNTVVTTNSVVLIPYAAPTVQPPAIPALSGITSVIINQLIDDSPYITNGVVSVDVSGLYNSSNPHGTGKMGLFGDVTFPAAQQMSVGIGAGEMAHHSFVTPVTITVGTSLTNLPAILGKWYAFASDGVLYDFTGKQVGNWAGSGFFHNWTISPKVNLGIKFGVYDDSVIPGIGYFGGITGTF